MTDNRYDTWRCATCGYEKVIPSVPLQHPKHCGTGMWFVNLTTGKPYEVSEEAL